MSPVPRQSQELPALGESNSGVQLDHLCVDEQTLLTNEPEIVQAFTELQGALQHSY